jgi:hypothetical protein
VAGVTKNADHRWPGSSRDHAASTRPIAGLQVESADLTTQHRHLVATYEQLDVLGVLTTRALDQQLQDLTKDRVSEREAHAG